MLKAKHSLLPIVALVLVFTFGGLDSATGHTIDASKLMMARPAADKSASVSSKYFFVDSTELAVLLTSHEQIQIANFPCLTGAITLDLKPAHSPIDATTQFVEGTAKGDVRISAPLFVAYRGKVLGEPNSRVFLTIFSGKMLCSITRESGEVLVLGPAKTQADGGLHILTRETDLLALSGFARLNCIADDIAQPAKHAPNGELSPGDDRAQKTMTSSSTLLQTDIAVEADSCFFAAAGNAMPAVLGYISSLFGMASSIYEDEANITWHLTWVKVWTSGDPYKVAGNAYALEPLVPSYWQTHYANVPRDLAHVMTSIGNGGGGYGWYSLCDPASSYSVSSPQTKHQYPTFAFTYDAYIVAHEIGHNFSLQHSHSCWWNPPLDTCFTNDDTSKLGLRLGDACWGLPVTPRRSPGTIMSYCQNANYAISGDFSQYRVQMTFSARGDDSLRKFAGLAQCIQPPKDTTLILISPRGSESYRADSLVSINWSFAHVATVALEYSPDGGSSWMPIASAVPATDGQYTWPVPNVKSDRMMVRVMDELDPAIADTSLLFFSVIPSPSGVQPAATFASFSIAPEPAGEILTLTSPISGAAPYEILDAKGVAVRRGVALLSDGGIAQIGLEGLPAGTYFLRISSGEIHVFPFVHIK
ncbi:MAG: M12 family metallo-peptidase [Bacteroidota bacterium]|nr:M12 family metallo-peptidase [Bacteroidota bacterium]